MKMRPSFKTIKEKLLENIVYVIFIMSYFLYSLINDGTSYTARVFSFFILFPLWLGFTYTFLTILFDWSLLRVLGKDSLGYLTLGLIVLIILFYFGWREELYVYVAGGSVVGAVMFIVEKLFSIGRKNQ